MKKKFLAFVLLLSLCSSTTVMAEEQTSEIVCTIPSSYTVSIPKTINLVNGQTNYNITVSGDICSDETVKIIPENTTITMVNTEDNNISSTATITQSEENTLFNFTEIKNNTSKQGTITFNTESLTAGNYAGTVNFLISVIQPEEKILDQFAIGSNMSASLIKQNNKTILFINGTGQITNINENATTPYIEDRIKNYDDIELILGEGITEIGAYSFKETANITSIQMPSSVTTIGSTAFRHTGLKQIDISNITNMGDVTFAFSALESIEFPTTIETIPYFCCGNCENLTSAVINEGTKIIGTEAFKNCSKLTIEIPASVTRIDADAFLNVKKVIIKGDIEIPEDKWGAKEVVRE